MPGVTAAILGHEAPNIKAKGCHTEAEGVEDEKNLVPEDTTKLPSQAQGQTSC